MVSILIVDRDEGIAGLLRAAVSRSLDCEVTVAHDAEEAATALGTQVFDLVLLDIGMYSEGLRTLRKVRGPNANCEVIALTTGLITAPLLKILAEADVFAVITKPFDTAQLSSVIEESVRASRFADPNRPLVFRTAGSTPTRE